MSIVCYMVIMVEYVSCKLDFVPFSQARGKASRKDVGFPDSLSLESDSSVGLVLSHSPLCVPFCFILFPLFGPSLRVRAESAISV